MLELNQIQRYALFVMAAGYALGAILPILMILVRRGSQTPAAVGFRTTRNLGLLPAIIGSIAGCVLALLVLLSGQTLTVEFFQTLPFGAMAIQVDRLSAFFAGVISFLALAVSIYSFGYATGFHPRRNVGLFFVLYNIFLLSMTGVVIAGHAVLFVFIWEAMSLTTFFLINFEHEEPASRRAAFLYIVMTHIGTAFLVVMFLHLEAATGTFSFLALKNAGSRMAPLTQSIVFLCATIGFGVKSGIIPFHIWLPEAHPAAPTNISALMSGVMIKTGIYGLVRVYFDFLGPCIPEWWGVFVLILAVSSAVLGVLYALMEHDMKRLLAFHSIENIGIILMGVGGALLFASRGYKPLAAIALIAGLYHVLNHATFKGLLFLGAGSVLHATHSRNIENLGGLIKRMPWTSFFFLVGAAAISALPPLNGFVSEWLTFQALLMGFQIPDLVVKIAIPLTVALLALTGALAAACFVKAFGIAFLGNPRSVHAEGARESSFTMIAAMGVLAVGCVALGIAPGYVVSVLDPLAGSLLGESVTSPVALHGLIVLVPQGASTSISPALLAALLVALAIVPLLGAYFFGGKLRRRIAPTWACGLPALGPHMQYTATGFSKPIRMIFSSIYRATHEVEISEETSLYFRPSMKYELKTESVFLTRLYEPVYRLILNSARFIRRMQTGHLQSYLAYLFITLVLLLLFAR